jgi:hypothetical protein
MLFERLLMHLKRSPRIVLTLASKVSNAEPATSVPERQIQTEQNQFCKCIFAFLRATAATSAMRTPRGRTTK